MNTIIDKFDKQYGFLSNFAPYPVFYDGFYYPTVENAFQAAKTLNMKERKEKFDMSITPGQAKRNGRRVKLREDWEDVKVNIMYELVLQKFTVHPDLTTKLLQTYPAQLIEGNYWHDTFWGVCNGTGKNMLGKILMKVRDQLRMVANNTAIGTAHYHKTFIIPTSIQEQCHMTGAQLYDKYGFKRNEKLLDVELDINEEYKFCLEIIVPDNPNELPQIHPCFLHAENIPFTPYAPVQIDLDEPDSLYGTYQYVDEDTDTALCVEIRLPQSH